jgi:hypothetical protein
MTDRYEFSVTLKRAMAERSQGICEAGIFETEKFYGMAKGDKCKMPATEFDHIIADSLRRMKPQSADEGAHVCGVHHKIKSRDHDMPKIRKAKRNREASQGITRPKAKIQSRGFGQGPSNTKDINEDMK